MIKRISEWNSVADCSFDKREKGKIMETISSECYQRACIEVLIAFTVY